MLKKAIASKIMRLDPFTMGIASGFGVNKFLQKLMAKNLVGKSEITSGLKWKERRQLQNIIHSGDVAATQKELGRAAKNVYEKGELPGFVYPEGAAKTVRWPKRLRGVEPQLSKTDKVMYRAGKYGPTALAIKAPIAGAIGASLHNPKRPKRPTHLPDNLESWKSLDKSASESYIKSKENIMFKNAEFQISFSDELHKIATSETHPEAVELLKTAGPWQMAGKIGRKAWRFGKVVGRSAKRFGANPILKTKEKLWQTSGLVGKVRASRLNPFQAGRVKGLGQQGHASRAVADPRTGTAARIRDKRNYKIQEVAEKFKRKTEGRRIQGEIKHKKERFKYRPLVEERAKVERMQRNRSMKLQQDQKARNIEKGKMEEAKVEVAALKAQAQATKDQSIVTRVGGSLTAAGTSKSTKTLVGAAAVGVPGYAAYNLTMADKKKKDNSIFKFGGK